MTHKVFFYRCLFVFVCLFVYKDTSNWDTLYSVLVHVESVLVHVESVLVHVESVLVHVESVLVHIESGSTVLSHNIVGVS